MIVVCGAVCGASAGRASAGRASTGGSSAFTGPPTREQTSATRSSERCRGICWVFFSIMLG